MLTRTLVKILINKVAEKNRTESSKNASHTVSDIIEITKQLRIQIQHSQFDAAISTIDKNLNISRPESEKIELLYLKAVAQRFSKQPEVALATLEQLLALNPEHARAYQEQGHLYKGMADTINATNGFYQATQRNPALLVSWQALKSLYFQMGNMLAVEIASQQIQYLEKQPKPLQGALDLFYEGKLYSAEQVCRQFLQQHKHHADAMILLAKIGIELKIYSDAEFLLESCVELYPEQPVARIEYCNLLIKIGKFQKAKTHSKHLLNHRSNETSGQNPAYMAIHASALMGLGEIQAAIEIYQQLLEANTEQPSLHLLLGHALKAQGNLPSAIAAYQNAYFQRPDFGDAYWSLANTKTYDFNDTEIQNMHKQVEQNEVGIDDKIHMLFALGKAFENREEYNQAFDYYAKGNKLKHQQSSYDADTTDTHIDAQIQVCTPALFTHHKDSGFSAPDPIFIVGLPRAGSTLLEQILASHSQVDGTMELPNILSLVARLKGNKEVILKTYTTSIQSISLHLANNI